MGELDFNDPLVPQGISGEVSRVIHEYEVTYSFSGRWSISVEASSPEEAQRKAGERFQIFDEMDLDVIGVETQQLDVDEENIEGEDSD